MGAGEGSTGWGTADGRPGSFEHRSLCSRRLKAVLVTRASGLPFSGWGLACRVL